MLKILSLVSACALGWVATGALTLAMAQSVQFPANYPGVLTAPQGGLLWGQDSLSYDLDGPCTGSSVGFVGAHNTRVPAIYLTLSGSNVDVTGNWDYPASAPCSAGQFHLHVQIAPNWGVVPPGQYTFVVKVNPDVSGMPLGTYYYTSPVVVTVRSTTPPVDPIMPVADLWWAGASESGWGLSIGRNGDALFVAGFIYGYDGQPTWAVAQGGSWDASHTVWTGDVLRPHGTAYDHYDASKLDMGTSAGKATLTFHTPSAATFQYLGGYPHEIQRYDFAQGAANGSYHGYWWGGVSQNGWGLHLAQQGDTIFATWYTYGADGSPTWFFMPGATKISATHFTGALYRTTGSSWPTQPVYDSSSTQVLPAGTLDLSFSSDSAGTMTAIVDGKTIANPIQRFGF